MKNPLIIFLILIVLSAFIQPTDYTVKESTAEVDRFQGLYVFVDSEPVMEYEYLGTVGKTMGLSGQFQSVRNGLIKKAKKQYPEAHGIILNFKEGGTDRADVIKFKQ